MNSIICTVPLVISFDFQFIPLFVVILVAWFVPVAMSFINVKKFQTVFFKFVEPIAEKLIKGIVQRRNKFLMHLVILVVMFLLYGLFYFGLKIL